MRNVLNKEELIVELLNLPQEYKDKLLLKELSMKTISDFLGYNKVFEEDIFYIKESFSFPEKISLRGVSLNIEYIHDNVATYYNEEGKWFVDVIFNGEDLICISPELLLEKCSLA